jgi:hypothetical protein
LITTVRGTHPAQVPAGEDRVALAGEQEGLLLIDDEEVDPLEELLELGPGGVDPQVEGVGQDKRPAPAGELVQDVELQRRLDGAEHDEGAVPVRGRQRRRELLVDIELDLERVPALEVVAVPPRPEEGAPPRLDIQAGQVHAVPAEPLEESRGEIRPDHADQAGGREVAGRDTRVARRAPKDIVALRHRRCHPVDRDRADDQGGPGFGRIGVQAG